MRLIIIPNTHRHICDLNPIIPRRDRLRDIPIFWREGEGGRVAVSWSVPVALTTTSEVGCVPSARCRLRQIRQSRSRLRRASAIGVFDNIGLNQRANTRRVDFTQLLNRVDAAAMIGA